MERRNKTELISIAAIVTQRTDKTKHCSLHYTASLAEELTKSFFISCFHC